MENKNKVFAENKNLVSKPANMIEFLTEKDGLNYTYQDVKNAEFEGYTKGFNEGNELGISQGELKAIREIDINTKEMLSKIDITLKEITEVEKVFFDNFFPSISRVCSIVVQKIMPHFFEKSGKNEIETLLKIVIESLIVPMPIELKVSEKIFDHITECIKELSARYPEKINVEGDKQMSPGACEIKWEGGGAKWNLDSKYEEVEEKLNEYLKNNLTEGESHG